VIGGGWLEISEKRPPQGTFSTFLHRPAAEWAIAGFLDHTYKTFSAFEKVKNRCFLAFFTPPKTPQSRDFDPFRGGVAELPPPYLEGVRGWQKECD